MSGQEGEWVAQPRSKVDFHSLIEPIARDVIRQGLTVVVGSGWSAGKGLPTMGEFAAQVVAGVEGEKTYGDLDDSDAAAWDAVKTELQNGAGFEAALDVIRTDGPVLLLVELAIAKLLRPREAIAINSILASEAGFDDMTRLLRLLSGTGDAVSLVTTNYDRLVEFSARMAGLHVDDCFVGRYIGELDAEGSAREQVTSLASRRGQPRRRRAHIQLSKPHGSLDWTKLADDRVVRSESALEGRTQIVGPGLSKLQRGYEIVFETHRNKANGAVQRATSLLFIGYGFNDSHLQQHIDQALASGRPALLLTKDLTEASRSYLEKHERMAALYSSPDSGVTNVWHGLSETQVDADQAWSLDRFLSLVHKI